ncbi:MAG: oligopeptide/dipeptide ABC transporter ATP-binding protein [SAR324 cluster bacterium]|nr:oligopeptide/dipeptide ABC transporter ATP-binding protein [SAR324 cluster bacterium]
MPSQEKILHIKGLKTYFPVRKGLLRTVAAHVKAVDGVDLEIYRGETLGLVGESGCGKTTLGKSIIQLVGAVKGQILYQEGEQTYDLLNLSAEEFKHIRQKIQIVFQDPHSSLNPAFTVFGSLQDPLKLYGVKSKAERRKIIGDLLEAVNMRREQMDNYPHEFSGGQRQRIGIARALCVNPEVVICDEAVSALDVSIQAQVLQLLQEIKQARGLTYIFITHDLSVVEYISDRVAVMYLGKIVELAESEALYRTPLHPYTQALLSAIPIADLDRKSDRIVLEGDVPNPVSPPSGCAFHPRCPKFKSLSEPEKQRCMGESPQLSDATQLTQPHLVSCHYSN